MSWLQGINKWEARIVGMVLIALLSFVLVVISDAPRVVVVFGGIAGLVAGGAVWETARGPQR